MSSGRQALWARQTAWRRKPGRGSAREDSPRGSAGTRGEDWVGLTGGSGATRAVGGWREALGAAGGGPRSPTGSLPRADGAQAESSGGLDGGSEEGPGAPGTLTRPSSWVRGQGEPGCLQGWVDLCHSVVSDSVTHGLQPSRLLCPQDSPGKSTGLGSHFLLQGIFPAQGSNPCLLCLLHCRQILYPLSDRKRQVGLGQKLASGGGARTPRPGANLPVPRAPAASPARRPSAASELRPPSSMCPRPVTTDPGGPRGCGPRLHGMNVQTQGYSQGGL